MTDFLYALVLSSGGVVALWGVGRCCSVETLRRGARDRQPDSFGGGDDRLGVHADGDSYAAR